MIDHIIKPEPLSHSAFAPFGEVIEINPQCDVKHINSGFTQRFHDLATLDTHENQGRPLFNIFRSKPLTLPFQIRMIERHPLSSQLFFPLSGIPFLVLVADAVTSPNANNLKLFITNGTQGINYKRNTWHHFLMAISKEADFIVIDRGANDENCEEYFFRDNIYIRNL